MPGRRALVLVAVAALALTAWAPQLLVDAESDVASQPTPEPSVEEGSLDEPVVDPTAWPPRTFGASTMPSADAAGQAQADAWLAGVVMPPGAVAVTEEPADAPQLDLQWQEWWCAPMGLATGFWRVPGAGVIDTANWLAANPGPGLLSPTPQRVEDDVVIDGAPVAHVPAVGAIEGIGLTVALASDGVVVRAEVGAFGDTTVCPTPPPGQSLGGPGQG